MTWPKKRQWQRQWQIQRQLQRQMHLEDSIKERSQRLVTFETFDQSDGETWPDQKKDNDNDKYKDKDNYKDKYIWRTLSKSDPRDLWPLRHLIRGYGDMNLPKKDNDTTNTKTKTVTKTNDWLVTFETLITIMTFENLNLHDNLCYLTIKSDTGQHSQFLRCFILLEYSHPMLCNMINPILGAKEESDVLFGGHASYNKHRKNCECCPVSLSIVR